MESKRNSASENYQEEEELELEEEQEEGDDEEENNEILKRRISSHPLYGLLVEAHLECLKVFSLSPSHSSSFCSIFYDLPPVSTLIYVEYCISNETIYYIFLKKLYKINCD